MTKSTRRKSLPARLGGVIRSKVGKLLNSTAASRSWRELTIEEKGRRGLNPFDRYSVPKSTKSLKSDTFLVPTDLLEEIRHTRGKNRAPLIERTLSNTETVKQRINPNHSWTKQTTKQPRNVWHHQIRRPDGTTDNRFLDDANWEAAKEYRFAIHQLINEDDNALMKAWLAKHPKGELTDIHGKKVKFITSKSEYIEADKKFKREQRRTMDRRKRGWLIKYYSDDSSDEAKAA